MSPLLLLMLLHTLLQHQATFTNFHIAKWTENSNTEDLNPWFEFFRSKKCVILEMAHHLQSFHLNYFCNGSRLGNVLSVMVHKGFSLATSVCMSSDLQINQNISLLLNPGQGKLIHCLSRGTKFMAGVEHLSVTWMHHYTTVFVLAINMSTCTVLHGLLSNAYSLSSTTLCSFTRKAETQYFHFKTSLQLPAAVWTFNYSNMCEGRVCLEA